MTTELYFEPRFAGLLAEVALALCAESSSRRRRMGLGRAKQ